MKSTFTVSSFLLCSFFGLRVSAQSYELSGVVEDKNGSTVATANVSLLKSTDSTWLQTNITNDNGEYVFKGVVAGKYIIATNALGYKTNYNAISVLGNTLTHKIVIELLNNSLDQVVVSGQRNRVRSELGKMILEVGDNAKQGKNVLELLRDLPGVTVSPTGTISVQGKAGLMVLLNGKPSYLEGEELAAYLRGLSAVDIKNVELMTQPSAKYDAEGNVGIININTDKKRNEGWSGNGFIRHSQGMYGVTAGNATINYKRNNVTLYATPGTYFGSNSLLRTTNTVATDPSSGSIISSVNEDAFLKETYDDYNLKLGTDIELSGNTTIGGYVKGIYHTNDELDRTKTLIVDNVNDNRVVNIANGYNGHTRTLWYGNAYIDHKLSDKHKLSGQVDYFRTDKKMYQRLATTNYDKYGAAMPDRTLLDNDIPVLSDLYSAKVDYTGSVGDYQLECGLKSSYVWIDDENIFYVSKAGMMQYDSSISNHFKYDESISAAYVSANATKGKWQAKAGLRSELSFIKGKEYVQGGHFSRTRLALFPTVFASCKADSNNTIELNYGRRIKRPYYRELNPFRRFESQYRYASGNPNLLPQYANNLELKHNYKSRLITSLSYAYTTDMFTGILNYDEQTNVSKYSTTNNGYGHAIDLSMYLNIPVINEWLLTSTGSGWYVANYNKQDMSKGFGYSISLDSQFTFKHGWYADINVSYTSRLLQSTNGEVAASVWSGANVSKKLFNDSGTLKLSVSDPFNIYRYKPTLVTGNTVSEGNYVFTSSAAILSFSYNFGNNDRKTRNSSTDELNRM